MFDPSLQSKWFIELKIKNSKNKSFLDWRLLLVYLFLPQIHQVYLWGVGSLSCPWRKIFESIAPVVLVPKKPLSFAAKVP